MATNNIRLAASYALKGPMSAPAMDSITIFEWLQTTKSRTPTPQRDCADADAEASKGAPSSTPESLPALTFSRQGSWGTASTILDLRSPSPSEEFKIRTIRGLSSFAVPVLLAFPLTVSDFIPSASSARKLYRQLLLLELDKGIMPASLEGRIEDLVSKESLRPCMWTTRSHAQDREELELGVELEIIRGIVDESERGYRGGPIEAHWNSRIQQRAIELALKGCPSVGVANVTGAQTAEAFRPQFDTDAGSLVNMFEAMSRTDADADADADAEGSYVSLSRDMADFALYLDADAGGTAGPELARLVNAFFCRQPSTERWINAMCHEPIREAPTPVFIETLSGPGTPDDAKARLATCLAGWHNRIRRMLDQTERVGEAARVITVPAIIVIEGEWEVFFVVDGRSLQVPEDQIVSFSPRIPRSDITSARLTTHQLIVGPSLRLGDTSSIIGMYRLLATLRALAAWMDTEFRSWMAGVLQDIVAG